MSFNEIFYKNQKLIKYIEKKPKVIMISELLSKNKCFVFVIMLLLLLILVLIGLDCRKHLISIEG